MRIKRGENNSKPAKGALEEEILLVLDEMMSTIAIQKYRRCLRDLGPTSLASATSTYHSPNSMKVTCRTLHGITNGTMLYPDIDLHSNLTGSAAQPLEISP